MYLELQELVWVVTILSFAGGIISFLFKKIVIDPLQKSIDLLNGTITRLEKSTNRNIDLINKEIDVLHLKTTRHDEQLKTLFNWKERIK